MSLVDTLKGKQGHKTQVEFAAELGIAQSALSQIYSGERGIGKLIAKRIAKRFPELTLEVAAFLLEDTVITLDKEKIAS